MVEQDKRKPVGWYEVACLLSSADVALSVSDMAGHFGVAHGHVWVIVKRMLTFGTASRISYRKGRTKPAALYVITDYGMKLINKRRALECTME
jgi:molybdenum-dependent DNA-binding transcriptional regulator ModE